MPIQVPYSEKYLDRFIDAVRVIHHFCYCELFFIFLFILTDFNFQVISLYSFTCFAKMILAFFGH